MTQHHWQLRLLTFLTLMVGIIVAAPPALAGSFQVNPVNLEVSPDDPATSLTIANSGDAPVAMRIVTHVWTQENGEDVYTETSNVITSPPIFTIEPGEAQLVRVGLRNRRAGEAYRVILEEIPRDQPQENLVQVALRLDLPLFVLSEDGQPRVSWQAWREVGGDLSLEASNVGTRHQKILAIKAAESGGDQILSEQMGVILPSSMRRWNAGMQSSIVAGSILTLKIRTPAGEELQSVLVQQR